MRGLALIDVPFVAQYRALQSGNIPTDDFEAYSDGVGVSGLNAGTNGTHLFTISWTSAFFDRGLFTGLLGGDNMEGYSDGAAVNGLNLQTAYSRGMFTAAYAARGNWVGLWVGDDFESYADGASVNGLNGGSGYLETFNAAYVAR